MMVTFDIAAILAAVMWPLVIGVSLFLYRKKIPGWIGGLAGRVRKIEFAGISIDLAVAKRFTPDWAPNPGASDLRHKATPIQINDSTAGTFISQLADPNAGDYALIDLGAGREWLSSRLFIMAIIFAQMKGIRCFVFVDSSGTVRNRFIGWAEPTAIRWALAKDYPWLEHEFAEAYAAITSEPGGAEPTHRKVVIVSRGGALGFPEAQSDASAAINLLKEFLQRIQVLGLTNDSENWVEIEGATHVNEHARWIDTRELTRVLDYDLRTAFVLSSDLTSKDTAGQLMTLLSVPVPYIAVVADNQAFDYLVMRDVLVNQLVKSPAIEQAPN